MEKDIADYAKDGRLTEPSDGKRYEWRTPLLRAGISPENALQTDFFWQLHLSHNPS